MKPLRVLFIAFDVDENSHVLAWQERVARNVAKECEFVGVLTERYGKFSPEPNMAVEKFEHRPFGVPMRLGGFYLLNVQAARFCKQHSFNVCFIHMAHKYAYRLKPTLARFRLPTLLWYAHGAVTASLSLALKCVDRVVTSVPHAFRIESPKVHCIGQSIDTDLFCPQPCTSERNVVVSVSRISPVKNLDKLILAIELLRERGLSPPIKLQIVGAPATPDDQDYQRKLESMIAENRLEGVAHLSGFVPHVETPRLYKDAFVHVNVSKTGSMDKTLMEALACGCPVLTNNEAYSSTLQSFPEFILTSDTPECIADSIVSMHKNQKAAETERIRNLVVGAHDANAYTAKVIKHLKEIANPREDK